MLWCYYNNLLTIPNKNNYATNNVKMIHQVLGFKLTDRSFCNKATESKPVKL